MADLDDICQGLAANLYALKSARVVGHVSAYMQENPQTPSVHVAGVAPFDLDIGFGEGGGDEWPILVEAVIGRATDIGSQKTLRTLLTGPTSLRLAAESDKKLTSRLGDNGRVTTDPDDPACQHLDVSRYLGQSKIPIGGAELLVATWLVRVIA